MTDFYSFYRINEKRELKEKNQQPKKKKKQKKISILKDHNCYGSLEVVEGTARAVLSHWLHL